MSVGLAMFILNEGKILNHFLSNLKTPFDQILVGIDDRTKDNSAVILSQHNIPFFHQEFQNDFSHAFNSVIEKMKTDWVMILAPDETLEDPNCIHQHVESGLAEVYSFYRYNWFDMEKTNKYVHSQDPHDQQMRLFRNNGKIRFIGYVHEQLANWQTRHLTTSVIHHFGLYYERIEPERLKRKQDYQELMKRL